MIDFNWFSYCDDPIQVADQLLGSVIGIIGYDDSLESVVSAAAKDRVVSLIERGVSYLVEQGVAGDISKYSTNDVSVNLNQNGTAFTQSDKKQAVSYTRYQGNVSFIATFRR